MKNKIHEIICQVAKQNNAAITQVENDMSLREDLGMSSMDLAQVIAQIDMSTGLEPLSVISNPSLNTVSDVVALYQNAAQKSPLA